jgi:exopolyphosphatase/guanosine-5'-triphosphate,3'-diphosphate pyrophosphatase
MLIAAIDIGTNSIHMVIAQTVPPSGFEVLDREREVVQVGRGSFTTGRLPADAIQRSVEALARFVDLARRRNVDHIVCTATAAVREARNGAEFLRAARRVTGVAPRVIPAEEEGRLNYLAVKSALQFDEHPSLIVDIGGGSVQLAVGNAERCLRVASAPLGALRLTEIFRHSDPPTRREVAQLQSYIERRGKDVLAAVCVMEPQSVYGSSGSIHALAQIAHWAETGGPLVQINGHHLPVALLERLTRRLARMPLAERERLQGIDTKRAEIILPAALVLQHVLRTVEADGITLSDFGVREGLVTDYIASHAQEISVYEQAPDLRIRSVTQLLQKFQPDDPHPQHVERLSAALFTALASAHGLPAEAADLLRYAALLHDVGSVIGHDGHAEHSRYIIRNGNLRGLSADEVEIVATTARYQGKARPRRRDVAFRALRKRHRRTVRWLAAILRLAEALDRSHYQLIKGLRVVQRPDRVSILVNATPEAGLELWAAEARTRLLSRLLGDVPVEVALDPALVETDHEIPSPQPGETRGAAERDRARSRSSAA